MKARRSGAGPTTRMVGGGRWDWCDTRYHHHSMVQVQVQRYQIHACYIYILSTGSTSLSFTLYGLTP